MNTKSDEKNMELKALGKKGAYILEASIILPVFLIGMILLISIIPLIAAGENALFAIGDELGKAGIKTAFMEEPVSLPVMVEARVLRENKAVDYAMITDSNYLYSDHGMDDLISIKVELMASGKNPIGRTGLIRIEQGACARAFTGKDRRGEGLVSENDSYDPVYVFPSYGERYHNKSCPFLNPACQKVSLTSSIKRRFKQCRNCGSASAETGDQVFCFFNDGKVYHLGNCSAVDKFYVEMDREDAIGRGYSACGSCGG